VLPNLVRNLLVERETRAAHVDGVDLDELGILSDGHGNGVDGPAPTDEAGLVVTHRSRARWMRRAWRIHLQTVSNPEGVRTDSQVTGGRGGGV